MGVSFRALQSVVMSWMTGCVMALSMSIHRVDSDDVTLMVDGHLVRSKSKASPVWGVGFPCQFLGFVGYRPKGVLSAIEGLLAWNFGGVFRSTSDQIYQCNDHSDEAAEQAGQGE